jgi:hypothetical protein
MSTPALMVDLRGPERFSLRLRTTLATPFSSSMVTTGRDVCLKSAKTDLPITRWAEASVAVVASEVAAVSLAALAVVEALAVVAALVEALQDVVAMVVAPACMVVVVAMMPHRLFPKLLLTLSPTTPPQAPRRTKPSTFATYVLHLIRWVDT